MSSPISVYRQTLRQACSLPHPYLQAFVKAQARDYFRRHRNADDPHKYLRRAAADLRRLEKVNRGSQKPFMRLLRYAYGRTGRLKRELLLPHLADQDPSLPSRDPIIPGLDSSRPPSYTRTLLALVCSPISRRPSKATPAADIARPKELPERADPDSKQARLLGPFSLRRTRNIHDKAFTERLKRVLPPLEVCSSITKEEQEQQGIHVPRSGLETLQPVAMLVKLATPPPPPRKQEELISKPSTQYMRLGDRSHRWLRRRYRELLADIPSINVAPPSSAAIDMPVALGKVKGSKRLASSSHVESIPNPESPLAKVHVSWASELALTKSFAPRLRAVTQSELEWIYKPTESKESTATGSLDSSPKK